MRIFDLMIPSAVVALMGVALWVFVLSGSSGESQPLVSPPPAAQAGLTPANVQGNRLDCDAIGGTNFPSPEERRWLLTNCNEPSTDQPTPPSPATPSGDQPLSPSWAKPSADQPSLPLPTVPTTAKPLMPPTAPRADEPPPSAPLPMANDLFQEVNAIWSATFDLHTYLIAVSIMNLAVDWYACDLTAWVMTEGGETESVFVGDLEPQEYAEPHIWVPLTQGQVDILLDVSPSDYMSALPWYEVELTWDWCQR